MEFITRLEALVEAGGENAVAEARALLEHANGHSRTIGEAVDDFLIDLMTVSFLVEAGLEAFQRPARRLARARLSRLRLLLA